MRLRYLAICTFGLAALYLAVAVEHAVSVGDWPFTVLLALPAAFLPLVFFLAYEEGRAALPRAAAPPPAEEDDGDGPPPDGDGGNPPPTRGWRTGVSGSGRVGGLEARSGTGGRQARPLLKRLGGR